MAATSSEDFLANALLSLKEFDPSTNSKSQNITTTRSFDQAKSSEKPILLEPSFQVYKDVETYEKLQLKSLLENSFRKKPTEQSSDRSTNYFKKQLTVGKDNSLSQVGVRNSWEVSSSYGSGVSQKPRKMMLSRWYSENDQGNDQRLTSSSLTMTSYDLGAVPNSKSANEKRSTTTNKPKEDDANFEPSADIMDSEDDISQEASSSDNGYEPEDDVKQSKPSKALKKKRDSKTVGKKRSSSSDFNTGWWSEEEHLRFLKGLKECGHNWKLISTKYVKTRGRRQCASHAQKWYLSIRYAEEKEQMEQL